MARVKLSEYDAKRLLFPHQLSLSATSSTPSSEIITKLGKSPLVVKVDQGVKKRGLQGLVKIGVDAVGAVSTMRGWGDEWQHFLVEPLYRHDVRDAKYLSLERTRSGWLALESDHGGIDIESHWDQVKSVDPARYSKLTKLMDQFHLATLELNPFLVHSGELVALDAAAEIDDMALALPDLYSLNLVPVVDREKSPVEKAIAALDASTPASLKFKLLNPSGSIWMLLSGGGASLVLADEVADQGMGKELANYGEYSGAPSDDDVYSYTKLILAELLKVKTKKKALVIAAGIANFTDVAKTFRGIIRALSEKQNELKKSGLKVFVRRGGPNEVKGLSMMREFLTTASIPHIIHFHDTPITGVISEVKEYLAL